MTKEKSVAFKTYVLELKNGGLRRVTVPATWKVTFGPTTPYERKNSYESGQLVWAVRFYEGNKENLRAIFTDVKSFRDESIPILEKVTKVQRKATQRATASGFKDVVVEARVTEWRDPDKEDEEDDNAAFLLEAKE